MAKDTKDGNNLNEKSYVNKKLLQCYLIISIVLLAAYIMELVKGNRTAGYVFVFSIILIVPVIMAAFAYKKNAESKIVRSITGNRLWNIICLCIMDISKYSFIYLCNSYDNCNIYVCR